jgi:high-affinity iron transporter
MAELIIVFREVLEGALIVGILYTYLNKTNQSEAIVRLWQGVGTAIAASVLGSILFQMFADGFKGQSAKLFEGVVMILAAAILGTVIVWMAKNRNIAEDLKEKADEALSSDGVGYGIFALSFISVFREGIETILFLYGVMVKEGGLNIVLSVVGAVLGLGVAFLIFVQGRKVPLKTFFNVTSILLIFVAAGMFTYGVHELESAKVIPYYGGKIIESDNNITATRMNGDSKVYKITDNSDRKKIVSSAKKWASRIWDINPPKNQDGSYPVLHDKGAIGGLMKGLFGYNGDPSLIELIAWIFVCGGLGYAWKKFAIN